MAPEAYGAWGGVQMKNNTLVAVVTGLGLSLVASSGLAHHSFAAQFDAEKPITLSGTVSKVEFKNPHAWFYIDVEDESGNVSNCGAWSSRARICSFVEVGHARR